MSLYQCEECGGRENTACGHYWGAILKSEPKICSECKTGEWHNKFPKLILPKGEFVTNKQGNLEHKESGSTDLGSFELTP